MSVLLQNADSLKYEADDIVIIDPPYNIGYKYNGEFIDNQTLESYRSLFEPMKGHRVVLIHYAEKIISDIVPILGNPERCVSWTYPSNTGSRQWRMICWFNCTPNWANYKLPYKNPNDKRIKELVKRTGGRRCPDHWEVNLVKNVSKEKIKEYTNQIPEEIIKRIIKTTAQEGDTIVDPFCGTGTTPYVAKKLGYSYRAYDINPLAIEITEQRLNYESSTQSVTTRKELSSNN